MRAERSLGNSKRLQKLAFFALLWAAVILCRLVYLQVICHNTYKGMADRQQHRRVAIRPPRGALFDRTGRPLAMSLPADDVCVNPKKLADRATAAEILARLLNLDRQELFTRIDTAARRGRGFLVVKKRISNEESQSLRRLNLDWIELRSEGQRYYPKGILAANLIGSVDFQERGNLGLERSFDKDLHGDDGEIRMLTDVHRKIGYESEIAEPASPGMDLTLTLDERIQYAAERALQAAMKDYKAASGSIVVMDPYTGDILAMANAPTFNPNDAPKPGDDARSRFNYALSVPFEPGSVFKVVTIAAGVDTGAVTPDTPINCGNGRIRLFGRVIREAKRGYGMLSVADVLAKSSNVGAIQVGLRLGEAKLLEYVRRFGFGASTKLPLPAESGGMVRDLKHWGKTSIGSVAMGHEISATSIQLARACSVIANGGMLVTPRLVLRKQQAGAAPVEMPAAPAVRIIKPETAIKVRRMMEGVVLHGTGKAAKLNGYTSGGKTGSAQIFDFATKRYTHSYNASFIGFAPVGNPRIAISVTLNGVSLFGGVVAAPVFRDIANQALRILDVPKDLPETEEVLEPVEEEEADDLAIAELSEGPAEEPQPAPEVYPLPAVQVVEASGRTRASAPPVLLASAAGPVALPAPVTGPKVPSFKGKTVRAVLEESVLKGFKVEVYGTGIARAQYPPAGAALNPGEPIKVHFSR